MGRICAIAAGRPYLLFAHPLFKHVQGPISRSRAAMVLLACLQKQMQDFCIHSMICIYIYDNYVYFLFFCTCTRVSVQKVSRHMWRDPGQAPLVLPKLFVLVGDNFCWLLGQVSKPESKCFLMGVLLSSVSGRLNSSAPLHARNCSRAFCVFKVQSR